MLVVISLVVASYILGSIPFGYVIGRLKGVDLREHGSGNVGATNCGRTLGRAYGAAAFALDFAKGLLPALSAAPALSWSGISAGRDAIALLLGGAAIAGHVFPVFLGFKGGKGVATSAGVCAGIHWPAVLVAACVWLLVLRLTRFVSLSSMAAAAAFPIAFVAMVGPDAAFSERRLVTAVGGGLFLVIVILHRSNISRLLKGEELRVGGSHAGGASR